MIFVSYSWRDRLEMTSLLDLFEERGVPYWVDSTQLDLRRPLQPQILAGLLCASAVAYLDTSASRASPWVRFELLQARVYAIPVINLAVSGGLVAAGLDTSFFLGARLLRTRLGDRRPPRDVLIKDLALYQLPPTFRFSGLRMTVQDQTQRSL
jgi:hypothetical protein